MNIPNYKLCTLCVCMYVLTCVCRGVCVCAHAHARMCVYMCAHVRTRVCVDLCMNVYACADVRIHTMLLIRPGQPSFLPCNVLRRIKGVQRAALQLPAWRGCAGSPSASSL